MIGATRNTSRALSAAVSRRCYSVAPRVRIPETRAFINNEVHIRWFACLVTASVTQWVASGSTFETINPANEQARKRVQPRLRILTVRTREGDLRSDRQHSDGGRCGCHICSQGLRRRRMEQTQWVRAIAQPYQAIITGVDLYPGLHPLSTLHPPPSTHSTLSTLSTLDVRCLHWHSA